MSNCQKVMALGFFDGLHIGHAELFKKVIERSDELNAVPSVMTFDVHPDRLVYGQVPGVITDTNSKREILRDEFKINELIVLRFTDDLKNMDYTTFLNLLVAEFNIKGFVVGHDFTFGKNAEGNAEKLVEYCNRNELACDIIPAVVRNNNIVSSTLIRKLIAEGNIDYANTLLGRNFYVSGTVVHGLHNGQKLGYPTVNLKLPSDCVVPRFGVYATIVTTEKGKYYAASDIGVKPTVCNGGEILIESNLLDFNDDLYGTDIRVELCTFIRAERKFDNFTELMSAIKNDVKSVRNYFMA